MITKINNQIVLLDNKDANLLKNYSWSVDISTGYVKGVVNKKTKYLHRMIMKAKKGQIVDHINQIKTDNRRINLRFVDTTINNLNSNKPQINNKSGNRNVCWHKKKKKWRVYFTVNYKQIHLGYFNDKQEAIDIASSVRDQLISNIYKMLN